MFSLWNNKINIDVFLMGSGRYVITYKSTFSKFKRAALTNTFVLHDQRGNLGILIPKRLLKCSSYFKRTFASTFLLVQLWKPNFLCV
ncbi:hypothetical protein Bca4012_058466 [Brassica carinata]